MRSGIFAPAQHGREQGIAGHQAGQTLKNQCQARSLRPTCRAQDDTFAGIRRWIALGIECPVCAEGHALVPGEIEFAPGRDAGRHIQADGIALVCRNRYGDGAVVQARGFRAKRGHVGRATNNGNPGKSLVRGHQGIIGHRALVRDIAEQHPPNAHIFRHFNGFVHRGHSGNRAERAVARDMGNRRRFFDRADIGPRIHRAGFEVVEIREHAQNPVRIHAAQICPHEHFRFNRGIFGRHARAFKYGLDKGFEMFCAYANVWHGSPFKKQPQACPCGCKPG